MSEAFAINTLEKVYQESEIFELFDTDKVLILSDLHLGDGGSRDDFKKNSSLLSYILENYYLFNNYTLILNGDIEELYKFKFDKISNNWTPVYDIFKKFKQNNQLLKIFGNHDYELQYLNLNGVNQQLYESIKYDYKGKTIFIYHGHQLSGILESYNNFSRCLVKYLVNPLRISGPTFTLNSRKIFRTEERAYKFSAQKKIISIIGHTHKPLFESLSRKEDLKYRIESLVRKFAKSDKLEKKKIIKKVKFYNRELKNLKGRKYAASLRDVVFKDDMVVPCLFNTGAVVGKHGITGIEINQGRMQLVYWFNKNISNRYINYKGVKTENLTDSDYYKAVLKDEDLDYIFSKIDLLS